MCPSAKRQRKLYDMSLDQFGESEPGMFALFLGKPPHMKNC